MIDIIFVILFKGNIDINFAVLLLKIMFRTSIIHIIEIWVFFSQTTSVLIEVTRVDDNYDESRIQSACLSGTDGTANSCNGTIKFDKVIDLTFCICINSEYSRKNFLV